MARRSNHEGSCYQRSDGLWVGTIRLGSKRVYRYGKTKSEASKKLREVILQHHHGTLAQPTKITLKDWVERWFDGLQIRPSTVRTYRQSFTPLLNELGTERLDRLSPVVLSDVFIRLARNGVGARRLNLAHGYLKACLEHAVDLEVLPRNPMAKVRRPKWEPRARVYWNVEQTATFLRACEKVRHQASPLFVVLATCGLRVSEALALAWTDIDLGSRTLKVERALVWSGSSYTIEKAKTRSGNRRVSIPDLAVQALTSLSQPTDREQRIFTTTSGEPPSLSNLRRSLLTICKDAGVPAINVHGLRHVAAALAFRATGDPYAVKHRLGHSHISVTLGIYAYGTRSDEQVAGAVDALLNRKPDQSQAGSGQTLLP